MPKLIERGGKVSLAAAAIAPTQEGDATREHNNLHPSVATPHHSHFLPRAEGIRVPLRFESA